MKNGKVKILVACHKRDIFYTDEVYTPIQVGKAISKCNLGFQGDDTGNNISAKNPMYCELTAEYWAWKNLHDIEYIGLCHYRRYFETKLTPQNIDRMLGNKHDVILAAPIYERRSMAWHLIHTCCAEDVYLFMHILNRMDSECFSRVAYNFLRNNKGLLYNMFVMKKELFDEYAKWQFSILFELEKYLRPSGYSRMRRVYGYIGEMLLPIWCIYKNLKIKHEHVVPMIGTKYKAPSFYPLRKLYTNFVFSIMRSEIFTDKAAVEVGLKNDGILN